MNEATRAYIYRVSVAAIVVAVAYGLISQEEVQPWMGLLAAMLIPTGLATKNTSTKP